MSRHGRRQPYEHAKVSVPDGIAYYIYDVKPGARPSMRGCERSAQHGTNPERWSCIARASTLKPRWCCRMCAEEILPALVVAMELSREREDWVLPGVVMVES